MPSRVAVLVAMIGVFGGCRSPRYPQATWPDAPLELRDDTDREQAMDALWAMPPGPAADAVRGQIAAATTAKIIDALEEDDPSTAAEHLAQLVSLWQTDPTALGRGLAGQTTLLHRMRDRFARSGALSAVTMVLVVLAEADPDKRAAYLAEIDEVLAFADELASADAGQQARRAQPIQILQPVALAIPLPWLVDRYVELLEERQQVIATVITQTGATLEIVRAHPDLLRTARRIANVLARAGRVMEIHRHLATVKGIGSDRELTVRAEVIAEQPTGTAYGELAAALRVDDKVPDPTAALSTSLAGLAKFPDDSNLLAAAAGDARALGRVDQPIALYGRSVATAAEVDTADAIRLGKLYAERITRDAAGGRPAAARASWRAATIFSAEAARKHPHAVWSQTTAIAESALGRGFLGLGLLDEAAITLAKSIERAPSIDAYEALATLNFQIDRFGSAAHWVAIGLERLGDTSSGDRYRRAKLERIAGDIARGAGKPNQARDRYADGMRAFASLGEDKDLPRSIAAERLLERGRSMWWLGEADRAVEDIVNAVELDPDSPAIASTAVGFLLEVGRYTDAVDAFHNALGSHASELYKTYMSLWIIGDARRRGESRDRLAAEYLANRHGDVWYELLAEAATNRLDVAALRARATTGPRQAELAFYSATLGLDPAAATPAGTRALLQQVVAARIVMDAEYDLARVYLRPAAP